MLHKSTKSVRLSRLAGVVAWILATPVMASAQPEELLGVTVGRVYEVDRTKYEEYRELIEARFEDSDSDLEPVDPDEYLVRMPDSLVTARQLSTNESFQSERSDGDGEYLIREMPIGAYRFTIFHEDVEYPVRQHLDLNVELSYIAELCFVVDREEQIAWMISEGMRRHPDAPLFVPERCQSALSGCLALLTGDPDGYPNGLLLLLAGSGATAAALGIISVDEDEASPPNPR